MRKFDFTGIQSIFMAFVVIGMVFVPFFAHSNAQKAMDTPLRLHVVVPADADGEILKAMLEKVGVRVIFSNKIWGNQDEVGELGDVMLSQNGPRVIEFIVEKRDPRGCIEQLSSLLRQRGLIPEVVRGGEDGPFTVQPKGSQHGVGCRKIS